MTDNSNLTDFSHFNAETARALSKNVISEDLLEVLVAIEYYAKKGNTSFIWDRYIDAECRMALEDRGFTVVHEFDPDKLIDAYTISW